MSAVNSCECLFVKIFFSILYSTLTHKNLPIFIDRGNQYNELFEGTYFNLIKLFPYLLYTVLRVPYVKRFILAHF